MSRTNVDSSKTFHTINSTIIFEDKEQNKFESPVGGINTRGKNTMADNIEIPLQDVAKLKDDNEDVVGFLQVLNTNINYPFVQTTNNSYYLTHDLYRNSNGGGWVFLDYRNQDNFDNKNSIIYAHGRENHTMFGTLKNVLDESWYQNEENYVVKLATQTQSYVYQVFSVYRIENTNDYIQTEFQSDSEYLRFLTKLQERSIADFQTTVSASDKILTLSTCYNDYEKVVLHAKLIKQVTLS